MCPSLHVRHEAPDLRQAGSMLV